MPFISIGITRAGYILSALVIIALTLPVPASAAGYGKPVPVGVEERLAAGIPQELIVLYDDTDVEAEAAALRRQRRLNENDRELLSRKAERYREIKSGVASRNADPDAEELIDYDHLPMRFIRFKSPRALGKLLSDDQILAVYENFPVYRQLAQSLPLIRQPDMSALGYTGAGTTVAILDTGVTYTRPEFGSCTSPGVPASCRVVVSQDIATNDNLMDDASNHGTNVAGIVAAVAPESRIAMLDIFEPDGTSTEALVISGINWAIANKATYNITAINMSLGNGLKYTAACSNKGTNPFVTPIANARDAGIMPVAASGNERYTDGISRPACTPGVISVGAVYDSNVGGLKWGTDPNSCTDSTTASDMIACFSNSAPFLTMLAPGAMISAAGITKGGTSQATPHVAGAVAVLRAAFPMETLTQIESRLTAYGKPITDARNGITKPRLDLQGSLGVVTADLSLSATISPSQILTDQPTTLSATVTNLGPSDALNTRVSVNLPSVVSVVSTSLGCSVAPPLVTCIGGTLPNLGTASFNIVLSSATPGQLTLTGSATSDTADPHTANNSATGTITVNKPLPVPALSPWIFIGAALLPAALGPWCEKRKRPADTEP